MDLYIVRHAIAFDADPVQWPDDRERPLTPRGDKRFRQAARALSGLVPTVDLLLSSPLVRAWQTAEILSSKGGWPTPRRFEPLEPGRTTLEVVDGLQPHAGVDSVALVGHEPNLSELMSYLLTTDQARARIEFKKGAVALLSFDGAPQGGAGTLRWLLTPRVLRSVA